MIYTQLMHQGIANPAHSMANKGGGGGGSAYYGNMDKLYGEQARAARFMLDQSMPKLPGAMDRTAGMVDDAFSGALGERARATANADAQASLGMGLASANRNMERYGAEFNPTKVMYANRDAGLQGAAMRAGAMNSANQWAEDQKWNRNAGQFAQLSGMGDGAMSGLSSAAGGFGQMANMQNQNDMANAQGFGQFGAALAGGLMKKADGGYINKPVKMAGGGDVWSAYKSANPIQASKRKKAGMGDTLGMVAAGAAPHIAGEGLRMAWNKSGAGDALSKALGFGKTAATDATVNAGTQMGTLAAQDAAVTGAAGLTEGTATAALGEQGAMLAAQDAAVTGAAGLAEGTTAALGAEAAGAAAAGGSGAMAGLAAAAPWLAGGLLVGHALDLFADGGDVQGRKDMRQGGKVTGPGTETSDDVPAWLSDGEYVLNAEAVKLAGKENLEKINNAGLDVRNGKTGQREAMVKAASGLRGAGKQGVKLAGGGYLGVALGSGVQQFERQKAAQREDERFKQQQTMQERQMKIAEAAAARQEAAAQRLIDKENKIEAVQNKAAGYIEDANAIAGFDTSHMTPEEKAAAGRAYIEAGYSPEALRGKATNIVGAQNLVAGMRLNDMLRKQEQDRRRGAAGQAMASGDIGGAISNAGGDWTQQGFGLSILGTTTDKRTGAKTITIGKEGKPVAAIDASLLGDFTESLIDPSKAPAFSKEQRALQNMYRDDARAQQLLAITAGSAALNNRLTGMKIDQAELQAERDNAIHDLRVTLSKTKDPEQRESIQQQITDLVRVKPEGESHQYEFKVIEDMMGNKSIVRANKKTGDVVPVYYQDALRAGQSGSGKNSVFTPPPGMNALPAPQKPVATKDRQPDQSGLPEGAKHIGYSKGKAVYELPDGSRIVEQ